MGDFRMPIDMLETIRIPVADLRWLTWAIRNVQTRSPAEGTTRQMLIVQFDTAVENNPAQPEFAMVFTRTQAALLLWSVQEGRCRDGYERLIWGRLRERFEKLAGTW
jgi:hypothetical protein